MDISSVNGAPRVEVAARPDGETRQKFHLLYVDDEEHNLVSFRAAFRPYYHVHTAISAKEGIRILRDHPIHVIITDQRMPEMTGVQFLEAVIPEYPDAIRMILTGFSDIEAIIKAINSGRVYRYITKPWDENELKMTIDSAIAYYGLQQRNRELVDELQGRVQEQERILKLFERYVPENVVRDALDVKEEKALFDGETRVVSVLFADLRDFTALASRSEPSTILTFLNEYFAEATACVKRHKGTVNKFIGDGVLAMFGAPVSYLDNQENAVRCALEMRDRIGLLNDRWRERLGQDVRFGIGINTGEVIVGNIGSEDRVEYTAIGDTVNVGARIEALTHGHPDAILISESTWRCVDDVIDAEEWPPVSVAGKDDPLVVREVRGVRV